MDNVLLTRRLRYSPEGVYIYNSVRANSCVTHMRVCILIQSCRLCCSPEGVYGLGPAGLAAVTLEEAAQGV